MNDKVFFDSNILVYANDSGEPAKQEKSKKLILDSIQKENAVISVQVLSEFFVTVTKKIQTRLTVPEAEKQLQLLSIMDVRELDFDLVMLAVNIHKTKRLSYWDSLIIASAESAGCTVLYSEDMNSGQTINGVTILNPYK